MPYQQIDKEHYPQLYKNKRQRVVLSAIGTGREQGAHLRDLHRATGFGERSVRKVIAASVLQRCNDQFGNVGIFLQQAVRLFRRVIQRLFCGTSARFWKKSASIFSANRRRSSLLVWAYRSVTIRDCAWPVSPCTALIFPPPICSFSEALQCRRL